MPGPKGKRSMPKKMRGGGMGMTKKKKNYSKGGAARRR